MHIPFLTSSIFESQHGKAIEKYFSDKDGEFKPVNRAIHSASVGMFLCFTNRCGSTLVASEASALGYSGEPNSHLNYEFFNSDFVIEYCEDRSIINLQQYIESIFDEFKSPLDIFFTKGSLDQLAWLRRVGVIGIAFPKYNYIQCLRRDLIAQAVSFLIAEQTNQWTSLHGETCIDPIYDFKKILDIMIYFNKINSDANIYFNILGIDIYQFVYEDIIFDMQEISKKIQFLTGIAPLPRKARTLNVQKQSSSLNAEWYSRFRDEFMTEYDVL